jgi:ABC-type methionine transport system ATPase subunit
VETYLQGQYGEKPRVLAQFTGDNSKGPNPTTGVQRQRVAIARSIISRPKILIQDEATSPIDAHGEKIVQKPLSVPHETE